MLPLLLIAVFIVVVMIAGFFGLWSAFARIWDLIAEDVR